VDDEDHMRIIPPDLFVRLRQEMAASRINKLLYSSNSYRFSESSATTYMNLEADRLKEERGVLDGVDNGRLHPVLQYIFWLRRVLKTNKLYRIRGAASLRSIVTSSPLLFLQHRSSTRTARRSRRFILRCYYIPRSHVQTAKGR
jgi:hypothetical protein